MYLSTTSIWALNYTLRELDSCCHWQLMFLVILDHDLILRVMVIDK